MQTRKQYLAKLAAQLAQCNAEICALESNSLKAEAPEKEQYETLLWALRMNRAKAVRKLNMASMTFDASDLPSKTTPVRINLSHSFWRMTMTLQKRISSLFFLVLLTAMIGCAPTPTQEGTGEYIDDTIITAKVKAMIFNEPSLKSAEINVETFKGIVQLSGFVSSREDINRAVAVARDVKGVVSVNNKMNLK